MEQAGVSQGIVERIVCSHAVRTYFSWNCACICGTARYSGNLSLLWWNTRKTFHVSRCMTQPRGAQCTHTAVQPSHQNVLIISNWNSVPWNTNSSGDDSQVVRATDILLLAMYCQVNLNLAREIGNWFTMKISDISSTFKKGWWDIRQLEDQGHHKVVTDTKRKDEWSKLTNSCLSRAHSTGSEEDPRETCQLALT